MSASLDRRYECLGDVSKYPLLHAINSAIVHKEAQAVLPSGAKVKVKLMGHPHKLYAIDHAGIRYVEQNCATNSQFALRARRGAKIVWVIRLRDNQYLGYTESGKVFKKKDV